MYKEYNPNVKNKNAGDCVIRALSKVLNQDWLETYMQVCIQGAIDYDMPSANNVWGEYLMQQGYRKYALNEKKTIKQFAKENQKGTYVLCTGSHAVALIDGIYYDAFNSGNETILYFYKKE